MENEVEVYLGEELSYDEDDDVKPREFNDDLYTYETLFMIPYHEPSILSLDDLSWPECFADLHLPGQPKSCVEVFHEALHKAWSHEVDYYERARVVGDVNGTDIVRSVRIYARKSKDD